MSRKEYQAVVFAAGSGSRMSELCTDIPKCLLPVANLPLFWYPLAYLDKNGIKDVILIVPKKCSSDLKRLLTEQCPKLSLTIDFVELTTDQLDEWATADALRYIADKIRTDFIVMSGDFISDFPLHNLLNLHRAKQSALTCLLAEGATNGPIPGPKMKRSKDRDLIALDRKTNRILFLGAEDDFEDVVTLPPQLLNKYQQIDLTSKYRDCHLYVMKKWAIDVLKAQSDSQMSSIKADLVPHLIERQYLGLSPEIASLVQRDSLSNLANSLSFNGRESGAGDINCFALVVTAADGYVVSRTNNLGAYFEINKAVVRILPKLLPEGLPVSSAPKPQGHIGGDCRVGDSVSCGEKAQVKRSIIGNHCSIGAKAKIVNSVVMDNVTIGAGASISNTILCHSSTIGDNADVKDSIVAIKQCVDTEEKLAAELVESEDASVMDIDE
uniref:Translation initiation factor eIF2B subunit gamma n=1 Tax=Plectus sambesii TaxID=2011161 RepID=A0A914W9F5_9BILA